MLGAGGYGETFLARNRETGEPCVVKIVGRLRRLNVEEQVKECGFMQICQGHPNVIGLKDHAQGQGKYQHLYFIVMECAPGGEMFDLLEKIYKGPVPEEIVKHLFLQLFQAVYHCHKQGVAHRDIKLENVLMTEDRQGVKLIDFGLSHLYERRDARTGEVDHSQPINGHCGSKSYASPQILANVGYDGFATDVWSLAVAAFGLLNGFFPVDEAHARDWRFAKLQQAQHMGWSSTATILKWYRKEPDHLSPEIVDLLDKMLLIDERSRITMAQVLEHPWVTGVKAQPEQPMYNSLGGGQADYGWRGEGGVLRGVGGEFVDNEVYDEPVYRSMGAAGMAFDDQLDPTAGDAPPPMMSRQAAFGGVGLGETAAFGDAFDF